MRASDSHFPMPQMVGSNGGVLPQEMSIERGMARSLIHLGSVHFFSVALAIVRNKLYALWLGTAGIGILSQLNTYVTLLSGISLLYTRKGLVKYVSQFRAEERIAELRILLSTSLVFFSLVSGVLTIMGVFFSSTISTMLIGDDRYAVLVAGITLSVPFLAWGGVLNALMVGFKNTDAVARAGILGGVLALSLLVPLVYFWRIEGAVIGSVCTAMISLSLSLFYAGRTIKPEKLLTLGNKIVDSRLFRPVLYFGLAGVIGGTVTHLSHIYAKRLIIDHLGLEGNGIFQAAWGLSHQFLVILLASMSGYFYPRLSEITERKRLGEELVKGLTFAATIGAPVLALVVAFREELIHVLYSHAFVGASGVLVYMMLAEFVAIGWWGFSNAMAAKARLRVVTVIAIIGQILFCLCCYLLIGRMGQVGIALSYCASSFFMGIAGLVWAVYRLNMSPGRMLSYPMIASAILVATAVFLGATGFHDRLLILAATGIWGIAIIARKVRIA